MLRKSQPFAIAILGLSIATPAMALNPQPLPPGRYLPSRVIMDHNEHGGESQRIVSRDHPILRCHSIQVGDPRKQPPMLVCP
jgi:hypothetical protein